METSTILIVVAVVIVLIFVAWLFVMRFVFYKKLEDACLIYYEETTEGSTSPVKKYFGPTVDDKGTITASALTNAYNAKNSTATTPYTEGPGFVFKWLWPFGGFSRVETSEDATASGKVPAGYTFDTNKYTCTKATGETYVNYSDLGDEKKKPAERETFVTDETPAIMNAESLYPAENPADFLPPNSAYTDLTQNNFLDTGYHYQMNTTMSTNKNADLMLGLRPQIEVPVTNVGPWNNSTWQQYVPMKNCGC